MKKLLLIFSIFYFAFCNLHFATAQKHNNIWYFGKGAGIDFTTGTPVALTNGALYTDEAAAVISDSSGNLLFYSNGVKVWNAQHQLMENGDSLTGCWSTSQALIVPKPGIEDSIYYLFYADCIENNLMNGLRYAVIDLKYNNGLGEIIEKNVLLHYPSTEKITAVTHANGFNFWIIAHDADTNSFLTYRLTCAGLDTIPIISTLGEFPFTLYERGWLKSSIDGKKLAMATRSNNIELYDFDDSSGIVSNALLVSVDSSSCIYGVTFSPDNTKLYAGVGCVPYGSVYQFDLNAGTLQDIINSKTLLFSKPCSITPPDTCIAFGGMQIAPDGKIYTAHATFGIVPSDDLYIGVINNPNSPGITCNYNYYGFYLAGKTTFASTPNLIDTYFEWVSVDSPVANFTYSIVNNIVSFFDSSIFANGLSWYFGDGITDTISNPIHTYSDTGTYNVCLIVTNLCGIDSLCKQIEITIVTSIHEKQDEDIILVYPNPATNHLFIELNKNVKDIEKIIIHNILGENILLLLPPYNDKMLLNLKNMKPGIYFLYIQNKTGIHIQKIIKINPMFNN